MRTDEEQLRRRFREGIPVLPAPVDRVAEVGVRVRRRRMIEAGAGALGVGLVLAVAVAIPVMLPGRSGGGMPATEGTPVALTVSARTDGCNSTPPAASDAATLDVVANRLRSQAESRFPDSFAELEITDRVRVFRKPAAAFDRWVLREFAANCVELVNAPYSGREIRAVSDRIFADRGYWQGRGIDLNAVSVGVDGTITVGVGPGQVDDARSELADRYQTRVVAKEEGPVAPAIGTPGPPSSPGS